MRSLARPLPAALLLAGVAQLLFTFRLGAPSTPVFDETHYVPAARVLLDLARPVNVEHPLLGKTLIGAGIALFGDHAIGWRALSTLAGTATLLSGFAILWRLFGNVRTAALGSGLMLLNFTLFVQARIAMLDGFMAAFLMAGVAAMIWGMRGRAVGWWTLGAALLGLAVGVKWAAAPYVAYAGLAFLLIKWRRPLLWPGLGVVRAGAILALASGGAYLLTFLPAFFYAERAMTLGWLLPFQLEMYAQQTQLLSPHTYQSDWWSWPVPLRPIWYLYEPVDGAQRGVLLVGNPAVMWGGLLAVAACSWAWIKHRDLRLGGVAALWMGSYAVWAIIPKSLGFYYYYYLPSLFLPLAIAAACHRFARGRRAWIGDAALVLAAGLFLYFYPILSATPLAGPGAFRAWTLLDGWV
jgi:dolichyl-phosphate-mannose-protein mannosyltransferase